MQKSNLNAFASSKLIEYYFFGPLNTVLPGIYALVRFECLFVFYLCISVTN